jgi:integrase
MAKKSRGNNEGSIRERKKGQWEGRVTIGRKPDGRPNRISFYGTSRQEVSNKITDALSKLQNGTFVEPNKVTISQWLDKWMEVYQKGTISPNFYARRKDLIRLHITPKIGKILLLKLKPADIKGFYNQLAKDGRKPRKKKNGDTISFKEGTSLGLATGTIRHIHNILNPAMRQAVREGLVPKNVVADVTPPKLVKTREANPLDKTEAGLYLAALKDNRLYAGFVVELTTGLRRGELIGLHWSDIQNGVLKIRRQVSRVKHDDGSSSLEYTDLKTPSSYRSIVLPTITIAELKAHKARQAQEKLLAGKTYKDEGLIFCNTIGQKLDTRRFYSIHSDTLKKIGLKHRAFHDLRHSVASLLLQAGESIKTVQDIMGHADADTLMNVYAHLFEEMKQSAADKLDSIFAEPVPLEKTEGAVEEDIVVI